MRVLALLLLAAHALVAQDLVFDKTQPQRWKKNEPFSPLGFYDLRAYEQAYPGVVGSPQVQQASAARYWAYQGIAVRSAGQPTSTVWTSLGPETSLQDPSTGSSKNVSGRVSALAISPTCQKQGRCRFWVGTAGGGVWRTDDAMNETDPGWRWVGHGLGTNNIGSLSLDPSDRSGNTIYVGTGETNTPNNSGAGTGLYRSTDGGDHWIRIPTMITDPVVSAAPIDFTATRGIAAVAIDPNQTQTLYVATASAMLGMTGVRGGQTQTTGFPQPRVGLYKTENRGQTWSLIFLPPLDPVVPFNPNLGAGVGDTLFGVKDVQLDPRNSKTIYVTSWNNAIHRSAPSLENGDAAFKPIYAIVGAQRFRDLAMFDLTVRNGKTRIYVYNGSDDQTQQGLYRLDNADVPAAQLVTVNGSTLTNSTAWLALTTSDTSQPSSTSRRICSSQCFYDLAVSTPDGQPDTVILGGVQAPGFNEATIRSTDGGASFLGFGNDGQNPRGRSHVDVRVVVFHPRDPNIAFVGSDGGVVRNDGSFVDIGGRCGSLFTSPPPQCRNVLGSVPERLFFLNKGLQTLQFYNIAVDPAAPLTRMLGGLQDNSTIWQDGTQTPRTWRALFPFGDGTSASGFHPTKFGILFASVQSNRFFANFRNGELSRWVRIDDPITSAGERETIVSSTGRQFITFDQFNPDTQFTGFQHIWRTQNNGGSQTFLEASCLFSGGTASSACGDFVPLGVAFPFLLGSTPSSASRKPGDLTSDFYGADRQGGIIVAAERTVTDGGTLWAATNFGRLFVAKNADAPGSQVRFVRIDLPSTPNRFITRIVASRANPNVAFISYSGFNTLTPTTPGHVIRATYDPALERATFVSFDFDLGDLPINTLAFDDARGDLYAATDFGPLLLRQGSATWEVAGVGFPEALMVDLELIGDKRLLIAATHGLGIFYTTLPAVSEPLGDARSDEKARPHPTRRKDH